MAGQEGGRRRVVVLGGGTEGTLVANRLAPRFDGAGSAAPEVVVVDRDDRHLCVRNTLRVPPVISLEVDDHDSRPATAV